MAKSGWYGTYYERCVLESYYPLISSTIGGLLNDFNILSLGTLTLLTMPLKCLDLQAGWR